MIQSIPLQIQEMAEKDKKIRKIELKDITKDCKAKIIFISAFLNRIDFRKYVSCIAWETEVWLADEPNHMIHFNGDKIPTPYDS